MHKAIGSRKDFSRLDEDQLLAEYKECVGEILENEQVQKLDRHMQHCNTSRLQHSINVSYYSFLICRRMGWDYRSAARAGLLHDLYFYDWRYGVPAMLHGIRGSRWITPAGLQS